MGEDLASALLEAEGYRTVKRNYYCRYGEIDIISRKGNVLYFTEVKTRRTMEFGRPLEAVTGEKVYHMKRSAAEFMTENGYRGDSDFMVVEVYVNLIPHFI